MTTTPPGPNGDVPQQVVPQPVPFSWQFGKAQTPEGGTFMVVILHDPTGTKVLFLDRENAIGFFEQGLSNAQSLGGSGLIIPTLRPPGDIRG